MDERTELSNRLRDLLKQYFPQALHLCGDDLWRPLATAFLLKWPTLQALQKVKAETVKTFYHLHGSRSQQLIEQRLELIKGAICLSDNISVLESHTLRVQLICRELQLVQKSVEDFEEKIAAAFKGHEEHEIFASLPGAGPVLAPRLLAGLGSERERYATPGQL